MTATTVERRAGAGRIAWVLAGAIGLLAGRALGWDATLLEALATPPAFLRAALVGASTVLAVWLLLEATARLRLGTLATDAATRDLRTMIRGVRLVFLAVAALSAAIGWLVGHPLPFVIALVIAGVDILETSFLLFVVGARTGS